MCVWSCSFFSARRQTFYHKKPNRFQLNLVGASKLKVFSCEKNSLIEGDWKGPTCRKWVFAINGGFLDGWIRKSILYTLVKGKDRWRSPTPKTFRGKSQGVMFFTNTWELAHLLSFPGGMVDTKPERCREEQV